MNKIEVTLQLLNKFILDSYKFSVNKMPEIIYLLMLVFWLL